MTEIYLIRHAQSEGNLYRIMQGHWDGNVTEHGKKQIAALAERFRSVKIDALYSSDLTRTRLTAAAIQKYHDLPLIAEPRLREVNVGVWESRFFGDLKHSCPEQIDRFFSDPDNWELEKAETFRQVGDRAMEALTEIAKINEGKTVAVVSHGVTIRCISSRITGIPLSDLMALPIFGNTAVSRLLYENGRFRMEYSNDCSHLDGLGTIPWKAVSDLRCEYMDPKKDRDYYVSCYSDAWLCAHGSLNGFRASTYLHSAYRHYSEDDRSVMKLLDGEDAVGLVDLDTRRFAEEGAGWISLLYLRNDYRHRHYGIQLLARAMFRYKELGRRCLRLYVSGSNASALEFYRHHGFRQISSETTALGELLMMELELDSHE